MLAYVLLAVAQAVGLILISFGAPGVWLQLAALGVYGWWTGFTEIGRIPLAILVAMALSAELVRLLTARTGVEDRVRRRVGVAGLVGGGAGAAMGSPFPLLGSMFGALAGAFVGSVSGIVGSKPAGSRAALGGLVIATTMKVAVGIAVAAFTFLILLR